MCPASSSSGNVATLGWWRLCRKEHAAPRTTTCAPVVHLAACGKNARERRGSRSLAVRDRLGQSAALAFHCGESYTFISHLIYSKCQWNFAGTTYSVRVSLDCLASASSATTGQEVNCLPVWVGFKDILKWHGVWNIAEGISYYMVPIYSTSHKVSGTTSTHV